MVADGNAIGRFFDLQKKVYEKCLYVGFGCENKPVRAHSIQNGKVLDLLQGDNHVIMPVQKLSPETGPFTEFALVGRNSASTFTGLCAEHDAELFRLADTQPLDLGNSEQLNQLAYRAVMRELHASVEWAYRIDSLHQDNVRNGLVSADAPNPAMIFWDKGWRVIRYRGVHFDSPRANGKNPALAHHSIEFTNQTPTVAASSLFSVEHDKAGDIVGPMLTLLPVDEMKTVAIVAYPKKQKEIVEKHLSGIFKAGDAATTKRELSRLVIEKVENFALAPTFYHAWGQDKKKLVIDAYEGTAKLQNGEDFMLL